jgi:hypothetical protein
MESARDLVGSKAWELDSTLVSRPMKTVPLLVWRALVEERT